MYNIIKDIKNVKKNKNIDSPNLDLVDAYKNICKLNKHNNENIIILEEDAFMIEFDKIIYNDIDNFIQNNNFDIYSLGSGGLFKKYLKTNHGKLICKGFKTFNDFIIFPFFAAQALILSPNVRNKILNLDISKLSKKFHFDSTLTYDFNLTIFTYKKPLIVQCFPMSENQKQWDYTNGLVSKILKLDKENFKNVKNGWNFIYFYNYYILYIIIFILLIGFIYFFYKLNK